MRRCTLSSLAVFAVVIVMTVSAQAAELQWSGGVTLTESSDQSGIFSRIEVCRSGQVIGCWFSTSGVLPQVFPGPDIMVYGDFPGISRIEEVVLSPDHGITKWPAKLCKGKGYTVKTPPAYPGGYSLEWGVSSKDKHNRLTLVIIPINWSSQRRSAAANHLMVQEAPLGWEQMSDQQLFAFLRGFVPAWATPDPSVVAQMQMMQPVQIPALEPTPTPAPATEQAKEDPPQRPIEQPVTLVLLYGKSRQIVSAGLDMSKIEPGTVIRFRRDGQLILDACVQTISDNRVVCRASSRNAIQNGDSISIIQGGN